MTLTTLTAHQPNFLPWLPFFEKARASDVLVLLQHAQFVKGNFHNRFSLDGKWFTMSVNSGIAPLSSKKYVDSDLNWMRIKRRLPQYEKQLSYFDDAISTDLVATNIEIINRAMALLGGTWPTVVLEPKTGFTASERIIELCRLYGASTYLSGPSGIKYLDTKMFRDVGIKINFSQDPQNKSPLVKVLP